ncbi:MAG: YeeE/YedE thiosulfate transporter family protein, partial [Gammaproteobacteria bacterium]
VALGAGLLARSGRAGPWQRPAYVDGYLQPWKTALVLAGIGFASYALIGMPLGITTSYAKLGATVEAWFAPAHVASLSYFVARPLDYTPPFSRVAVHGGAGPGLDAVAAIQYPLIVGIVLGAALSARCLGEFRVYYRVPAGQYMSALTGGVIVGMAARMTPGCNIWHLWGGLPILATQSLVFLCGLVPGAWLGSRLLTGFVLRAAKTGDVLCTRN